MGDAFEDYIREAEKKLKAYEAKTPVSAKAVRKEMIMDLRLDESVFDKPLLTDSEDTGSKYIIKKQDQNRFLHLYTRRYS